MTQAHTDDQIRNLAGALISATLPFTYDASSHTLTYTQPLPADNSLTMAMLTNALQETIEAKIDSSAVEAAAKTERLRMLRRRLIGRRLGQHLLPATSQIPWIMNPSLEPLMPRNLPPRSGL